MKSCKIDVRISSELDLRIEEAVYISDLKRPDLIREAVEEKIQAVLDKANVKINQ